jgi:hypothetical protein
MLVCWIWKEPLLKSEKGGKSHSRRVAGELWKNEKDRIITDMEWLTIERLAKAQTKEQRILIGNVTVWLNCYPPYSMISQRKYCIP